ncbi:MAG: 4-hydroxy-3-methylbut-2-enyl diphosphate reductase [Solobacterium sp.]|nr:4-hydroxy-3-methylbut-2-enyl diphosphate reductase [Solobacterium sp.]
MEIIKVVPRGYCQGVVRAIQTAEKTARENSGQPIHMLGMIVHNRFVVEACEKLGIHCLEAKGKTRLELLDEIDHGTVIFTAHGVSDAVYEKAAAKGLHIVDATCPDVRKTHDLIRAHVAHGDVLYIGKKNHPEAEGAVGISPRVHLISCRGDLAKLGPLENVLITNQTTLSILDNQALIEACLKQYPDAVAQEEICNATTMRQKAVMNLSSADCLIVVGDPHSNNTNQLREIGIKAGIPNAVLIENAMMLKESDILGYKTVAVTSGSSTPNAITDGVIETLEHYSKTGLFEPVPLPDSVI